jgi:hypothetical protein
MSAHVPHRSRRLAVLAAALAASMLVLGGTARADGGGTSPFIQWHAAYSNGQTTGMAVGTVISLRYVHPTGGATVRQFCWNPAPIDQPSCSAMGTGAPAQAGTQTVTAQLSNGQSVVTQFQVEQAPTNLNANQGPVIGNWSPPVPYTSTCSIAMSGNADLEDTIAQITAGQQVGGYYNPRAGVTQVYDYSTNQAGFMPSACLAAPSGDTVTYERAVTLRSNRTSTYRLSVPEGFDPISSNRATPIAYQLYRGTNVGSGVGNSVRSGTSRFRHTPVLGAQVIRTRWADDVLAVTVRTRRVNNVTLLLSAVGTGVE